MLIVFLVMAIGLVALLVTRPSLTVARSGKILAFMALFIFPILTTSMGVSEHVERSKTTQFCTSCHVMQDYGKSLWVDDPSYLTASHFQNNRVPRDKACFTCHTDYTMYGDFNAKLRGLRHVYVQYLGTVPQEVKLYTPYNNRECLHCHAGARSFEEGATHLMEDNRLAQMKNGQLSCLTSGCHDVAHNVKELKNATFWVADRPADKTADESESGAAGQATPQEEERR